MTSGPRWVPVRRPGAVGFPKAEELSHFFNDEEFIFPVDLVPQPRRPSSFARRSAQRYRRRRIIIDEANRHLRLLNALDNGSIDTRTERGGVRVRLRAPDQGAAETPWPSIKDNSARAQVRRVALREAARLEKERRSGPPLSGAHATAKLVKSDITDSYGLTGGRAGQHEVLRAHDVDEPEHTRIVPLLEALPPEEAAYYRDEDNVILQEGCSEAIFKELESHYGFVGGPYSEYIRYLHRTFPPMLWEFVTEEEVRAIAGLSVVAKKQAPAQRKLLMQVATNYRWGDVRRRHNHGLLGGTAMSRLHVANDQWAVSCFDESNAFSSILMPVWMRRWCAAPPVRARDIWSRLTPAVRERVTGATPIYPRFCRLAMRGSHSVRIMMCINLYTVGKLLVSSRRLALPGQHDDCGSGADGEPLEEAVAGIRTVNSPPLEPSEGQELMDNEWLLRHQERLRQSEPGARALYGRSSASGPRTDTPAAWADRIRRARMSDRRIIVVFHLFAGPEREGDLEAAVRALFLAADIPLLFVSIDLLRSGGWDLSNPHVFHLLMCLIEEGCVDVLVAGPPCSTWSVLRWYPGGPRPLRHRDGAAWGLPFLRGSEEEHLKLANVLMINTLCAAEGVSTRGGGHLIEHPEEPEDERCATIWLTEEMIGMEERTGAVRTHLDQCALGGPVRKATGLSGTLDGMVREGPRCPGLSATHKHEYRRGRNSDGQFDSARLATYPKGLCEYIADRILTTVRRMLREGSGPTGWRRSKDATPAFRHGLRGPDRTNTLVLR